MDSALAAADDLVDQLRHHDRRKDEFLATLAHELRNPLAPICNALQLMRMAGVNGALEQARAMMERQLAQLIRLSNLLNNSAKYTPPGGNIRLALHREKNLAVVVVADNGIGIPPKMVGEVFEMFAQVDRTLEKTTGGLGIGLSLVKGLVEMHGGTIEARSEGEGRGSEFIARLPLLPFVARSHEPSIAEDPVGTSCRRRILIADDNVDSAESLGILLESLGNDVSTANDGEQAVDAADAFRPDVLLLDIGMPKLNGYEVCRRIREQPWGKDAFVVAMTGWGQEKDRQRSRDAGFDFHLVKPVDFAAVKDLLSSSNPKLASSAESPDRPPVE